MALKRKSDLIRTSSVVFGVLLVFFTSFSDCRPYSRWWYEYDDFPIAKPIQDSGSDSGSGQVLGTVNPLRPYEPWVLDCILVSSDKVEEGKRHPRCQLVDGMNEKEYAKFLIHVQQWEDAYPERAAKWNFRFPDAKEQEKKKYEQLKTLAEMHTQNLPQTSENPPSQRSLCMNCSTNSSMEHGPLEDSEE